MRRNAQWSGIVLFLQNMVSSGGLAWVRVNTLSARPGLYRLTWWSWVLVMEKQPLHSVHRSRPHNGGIFMHQTAFSLGGEYR